MKIKFNQHKRKLIFSLIIIVVLVCFVTIIYPRKIYNLNHYFNNIPNSVKILEQGGYDSIAGSDRIFCFEISPSDLDRFIKANNYFPSTGEILKQNKFPYKDKQGAIQYRDGLTIEKKMSEKKGIIPDEIYMKKKSTYSHYWLLIVNKEKTKVYFKYSKI